MRRLAPALRRATGSRMGVGTAVSGRMSLVAGLVNRTRYPSSNRVSHCPDSAAATLTWLDFRQAPPADRGRGKGRATSLAGRERR